RAARTGADVGGGAGEGAGGRQSTEQRGGGVGHALRHQLAVGAVAAAGHAVGDHRRQQRFHAGEEGDGKGAGQQFEGAFERDVREVERRQCRWQLAEAAADGVGGQGEGGGGGRA